jgi:hypothetical protein
MSGGETYGLYCKQIYGSLGVIHAETCFSNIVAMQGNGISFFSLP